MPLLDSDLALTAALALLLRHEPRQNGKPTRQQRHHDPDRIPPQPLRPRPNRKQTRKQRRRKRPEQRRRRQRERVERPQDPGVGRDIIQRQLDRRKRHAHADADDRHGRDDEPKGRGGARPQEEVAQGADHKEKGVDGGTAPQHGVGPVAVLQGGESEEQPGGLGGAVEGHQDANLVGGEAVAAECDGRKPEDGDDGRIGEGQERNVRVDVEDHAHAGGLDDLEDAELVLLGRLLPRDSRPILLR